MALSVDWDVARRIAARVGGTDPFADSYLLDSLEPDLLELTALAEELVAAETGLVSLAGSAKARVTDRAGWVDANLASFDRLTRPLLAKFAADENDAADENERSPIGDAIGKFFDPINKVIDPITQSVGPKLAGAQVGGLLGWMSGRVIGQYDLLIIEDEKPDEQDWVYYVGPNVLTLEKRYGFPPREFRLWIAIHECTHRTQFTAVPWLRPYFLSLVNELMDEVDPDPGHYFDAIKTAVEQKRSGETGITDGGLQQMLASPKQKVILDKVSGLMSLLEGHGDIVMDRAGRDHIPSQPRFARVMSQRRSGSSGPTKIMQKLLGFDAKLAQYEEGEKFIHAVEAAGGKELFDQVWTGPEALPTLVEIRNPQLWISRINSSGPSVISTGV